MNIMRKNLAFFLYFENKYFLIINQRTFEPDVKFIEISISYFTHMLYQY